MTTVLAFGASNSRSSINVRLARHAVGLLRDVTVDFLDLNDFEMPIFSVDRERASGLPEAAHRFKDHLRRADAVLISLAEHNGSYTVAFKNLLDWSSRIEASLWLDKPMCLLATSPGKRGGQSVLEAARARFPFIGGVIVSHFSLPSFDDHFDAERGITEPALAASLRECLDALQARLTG